MKLRGTPECIRNCKSLCFQDFCNSFVKMLSVDGDLIDAKGCIPSSGSKSLAIYEAWYHRDRGYTLT